jgi:hypothetical protein
MKFSITLCGIVLLTCHTSISLDAAPAGPAFEISFPASVHAQPITGRVFLVISRNNEPIADLENSYLDTPEFFGVDASHWMAGKDVIVDMSTLGYPLRSLNEIPPGEYYVQAFVNIYVEYHRADGHAIWGLKQWEGQRFARSPGNLYSKVIRTRLSSAPDRRKFRLYLTEVIPAVAAPNDTDWLKHIKIQSPSLTRFWGRPIYVGATVLLPRGYSSEPDVRYPVIYDQNGQNDLYDRPFGFTTEAAPEKGNDFFRRENLGYETGYAFYQSWTSDHFPKMIAVALAAPTPYWGLSGAMDSDNIGPYAGAIMTELIPYVEEHFRIIREPYARTLVGKSAGGREVLALQLSHPDFFGGAWIFYPWSFDFQHYFGLNIYEDENAFVTQPKATQGFRRENSLLPPVERPSAQTTEGRPVFSMRQYFRYDVVMGGNSGVGDEWRSDEALNGPVGKDGYPVPLWNGLTGKIDHGVASYWRTHDLTAYAETNWSRIGPQLSGKLHFYVGDMDEWYRQMSVHSFETFLQNTKHPYRVASFAYGSLKGHGWQPMTNAELVRILAGYVSNHAPRGTSTNWKDD